MPLSVFQRANHISGSHNPSAHHGVVCRSVTAPKGKARCAAFRGGRDVSQHTELACAVFRDPKLALQEPARSRHRGLVAGELPRTHESRGGETETQFTVLWGEPRGFFPPSPACFAVCARFPEAIF